MNQINSEAFLAAVAYCQTHDLPLQPGGEMTPDENNLSSDMYSYIEGFNAGFEACVKLRDKEFNDLMVERMTGIKFKDTK